MRARRRRRGVTARHMTRVTWPARRAARAVTVRAFSASATGARDVRQLWACVVAPRAGRRRYATYYPFARPRLPRRSAVTTTRGPFCPRSLLSSSPRSSSISRRHGLRARLRGERTPASVSWVGIFIFLSSPFRRRRRIREVRVLSDAPEFELRMFGGGLSIPTRDLGITRDNRMLCCRK